jgi:unsaturated rhamnogalacturonyl hydrolase
MKTYFFLLAGGLSILSTGGHAQAPESDAVRMANTVMHVWKDGDEGKPPRWTYDEGVVWKGLESCWYNTGDARYYK